MNLRCRHHHGTNSEFGFDYLRDDVRSAWKTKFQREAMNRRGLDRGWTHHPSTEAYPADHFPVRPGAGSRPYMRINQLIPAPQAAHQRRRAWTAGRPQGRREEPVGSELNEAGQPRYVEEMLTAAGLLAEGRNLCSRTGLGLHDPRPRRPARASCSTATSGASVRDPVRVILIDEHRHVIRAGAATACPRGLHQAHRGPREGCELSGPSQTLASAHLPELLPAWPATSSPA